MDSNKEKEQEMPLHIKRKRQMKETLNPTPKALTLRQNMVLMTRITCDYCPNVVVQSYFVFNHNHFWDCGQFHDQYMTIDMIISTYDQTNGFMVVGAPYL